MDTSKSQCLTYFMAGFLTGFAYLCMALLSDSNFSGPFAILLVIYLILAGLGASIATIKVIKVCLFNFNRINAILPIALFIAYMKMAPLFDMAI